MKRILLVLLALSLLFSCGGKKAAIQVDSDGYVKPDPLQGVNIFPNIGTFAEPEAKTFKGGLDTGEAVTWMDKVQKNDKNWEFALIKRKNGQEVWTSAAYIIRETQPGIIIQEGFIFSEPDAKKMVTTEKIEIYTIVAGQKLPDNDKFIQVSYSYPNHKDNDRLWVKNKVYVKTGSVSFFSADIEAAILFLKAEKEKDIEVKKEFLKSAYQLDTPSFKQMIKTALDLLENTTSEDSVSSIVKPSWSATTIDPPETYQVNENDVEYYSEPNDESTAISTLAENEQVTVDKRTTEQMTFKGTADYWYHMEDRGWVFGAYIFKATD